jgi:polar amino acid transport system permease protein
MGLPDPDGMKRACFPFLRWSGVLLLLSAFFFFAFSRLGYHWDWLSVWNYRILFLRGWLATLGISLAAMAVSLGLGLLSVMAARSRSAFLRIFSALYVGVVRGTPLLVQILILWFVVAPLFRFENLAASGVLALGFFSGAYLSEIFRAALASVGEAQWESARAIGLTPLQTYRYVVFSQAVRLCLPPMTGQFVSLVKDSSLLSVISINELTFQARQVGAYTYSSFESYLPLAAGYLMLTLPLAWMARRLEERFRYET